jgi:hypothetical protein
MTFSVVVDGAAFWVDSIACWVEVEVCWVDSATFWVEVEACWDDVALFWSLALGLPDGSSGATPGSPYISVG